jgi:hypothetical protein
MDASRQYSHFVWPSFLAGPCFLGSLALFGALTPGHSHLHRAVSRLGAVGEPWGLWFDFFGLWLPGLLTAGMAVAFRRRLRSAGAPTRWATGLLLYAVMMAFTAVPADFSRMFHSPLTWVHAFFVLGSPLVLFVVVPGCAKAMRALGASPTAAGVFLVLGYLPAAEFLLYGLVPQAPGLVQRLMIATTHVATAQLSWTLLSLSRATGTSQAVTPGVEEKRS